MKAAGDLSEVEKEHSAELLVQEHYVDRTKDIDDLIKAKMYVCLAHDWYQLQMEEEGSRLILKAEKVFPGYFKGPVIKHQEESPLYNTIIEYLTIRLYSLLQEIASSK